MIADIEVSGWTVIIGSVFLGLTQIAAMLFSYLRDRLAAQKVEAVRQALETTTAQTTNSLTAIADVGNKTHTLVNNAMAVQLKLNAVIARRLAGMTANAADLAAASAAEALYAEHMAKQEAVDAKQKSR